MTNGGAMALAGQLVTVVGGSGFLGAHVAQALLARGARVRVCSRRPELALAIKPLGNLGQVQLGRVDVRRPETLRPAFAGADAVINLVGAFHGDLDALQGEGAGRIAALADEAGARALVHVSALGADAQSASRYARTKAAGEAAVLRALPHATVIRPPVLFGPDDRFLNLFATLIARLPVLPVFAPRAPLQPLHVGDAALAVVRALADPARHGGQTYQIAGPEVITVSALNRRIAAAQGRAPLFIELPDGAAAAFATLTGWLPGAPLSRDQWAMLRAGAVAADGGAGNAALGLVPRPLELFLDEWMMRFRKHGRFAMAGG